MQPGASGTSAKITAAFSPYQDGTMVECDIELNSEAAEGSRALDWAAALTGVKQELDRAAAE